MRWPGRKHDISHGHIVDRGRVWCPACGRDVDIDRCYTCGAFEDLNREGDLEILHCQPVSRWAEVEGFPISR